MAQPETTTTTSLLTGDKPDWVVPPRGTVVRVGHLAQGCQQDECYRDPSKWKAVSDYSHQTSGDMRILDQEGNKVVAEALALAKHYGTDKISVIDLGCGDTRKIEHLLDRFESLSIKTDYYGLDILPSLYTEIKNLADKYNHVHPTGILSTFDDGYDHVNAIPGIRVIVSLGTTLSNGIPENIIYRFEHLRMRKSDIMLIGQDSYVDNPGFEYPGVAYHNEAFEEFTNQAIRIAKVTEADGYVKLNAMQLHPSYMYRVFVKAAQDTEKHKAGDEMDVFQAWKYKPEQFKEITRRAGLHVFHVWKDPKPEGSMTQYLIKVPATSNTV